MLSQSYLVPEVFSLLCNLGWRSLLHLNNTTVFVHAFGKITSETLMVSSQLLSLNSYFVSVCACVCPPQIEHELLEDSHCIFLISWLHSEYQGEVLNKYLLISFQKIWECAVWGGEWADIISVGNDLILKDLVGLWVGENLRACFQVVLKSYKSWPKGKRGRETEEKQVSWYSNWWV